MSTPFPRIATPLAVGNLRLPHRIVMGSMHTGREHDATALGAFYAERARGGAGLMVTGGLAVNHAGSGGEDYVVLTDPAVIASLAEAVKAVHAENGLIAAQLFHAGRYAVGDWAVAPSPIPWGAARGIVPTELDEAGIRSTIDDFAAAAAAARAAGFDAVEIMASEGYLLNQFLSPLTNVREDAWGGDAGARMRFPLAVLRAVREAVGSDIPVIVRLSVEDLMPGSTVPEEVDAFALALADEGADALSMGVGWHESRVPTVQSSIPHGAWVAYGERVADVVHAVHPDLPFIASNRIVDLTEAEEILARGRVDAVAMARPFLADADLMARSLAGNASLVNRCIGCNQACIDRSMSFTPVSCLVNPRAGQESSFPLEPSPEPRSMAVVGGGPAGLAAAEDLVLRGHRVTVFESSPALGGQFKLAARVPGKEDYGVMVAAAEERLKRAGVRLELDHAPDAGELAGFDGVVLATGVRPRGIDLPGADQAHVIGYEKALRDGVAPGPVAIIGGGGIGVDVAASLVETEYPAWRWVGFAQRFDVEPTVLAPTSALAERRGTPRPAPRPGQQVTLMRRSGRFGQGTGKTTRWVNVGVLRDAGVSMLNDLDYVGITHDAVEISREGKTERIPANTVVVCAGQESSDPLSARLEATGVPFEVVGGAREARAVDAVRATSEGLAAARRLTAI
ncbi:FAD-dependent oxidoreductase [Kocuria sp. TGY1127_2]|uniref:oxidoreductase n=1 Tax=Kocuria sp. TGY1127_2 TaxID=2711328 RepID=UPI0018D5E2EB|nr:FAD-dependent oxidoreductase [Kocuria sp. TGY1127_2]